MTNLEKIKRMSVDEMAGILILAARAQDCIVQANTNCYKCAFFELCMLGENAAYTDIEKWLESEVKDDA